MSSRADAIIQQSKTLNKDDVRAIVAELDRWLDEAQPAAPMSIEEAIAVMNSKPIPGPTITYSRDEMNER